MEEKIRALVQAVITYIAQESFIEGYEATPEECLGIALAHYFEWSGAPLIKTLLLALEDANYASLGEKIEDLCTSLLNENKESE